MGGDYLWLWSTLVVLRWTVTSLISSSPGPTATTSHLQKSSLQETRQHVVIWSAVNIQILIIVVTNQKVSGLICIFLSVCVFVCVSRTVLYKCSPFTISLDSWLFISHSSVQYDTFYCLCLPSETWESAHRYTIYSALKHTELYFCAFNEWRSNSGAVVLQVFIVYSELSFVPHVQCVSMYVLMCPLLFMCVCTYVLYKSD